ncbi:hypothetical protein IGI04_033638 [Brassica rapa subsp. trilocularis]|uniref:Zinc finger GRF-type domain-containing protein n=1 Tax=Brassica rapa subsp. trilocularis TaxID=1813537 RepID=A0ABQ7L9R5_BRACM|nr:hypothetical protein IGI04_033638 [Brassica rapa subsp. trilocularis]
MVDGVRNALALREWLESRLFLVGGVKKKREENHLFDPRKKKTRDVTEAIEGRIVIVVVEGTEMEEELRDMKAHKAYISMVDFVAEAQQGIPKLCPCGSITKEPVDEEDTYDYLPGKRYFICKDFENDGLHFRQPWVTGVTEEVERLKLRVHEHEKLLRECEALKAQVAMLVKRVKYKTCAT